MYIQREITEELLYLSGQYRVVMITGPRQAGKTSLAKNTFPQKPYFSLENPDLRIRISEDARGFFETLPNGAIIDEFQRYPELLSYIQEIVDEKQQNGLFILTGSNNFSMMSNVTQSLAGRVALLKLLPFSISEIKVLEKEYTENDYLYRGFYPRIYSENQNPTKAYRNYYETYVERDIRQIVNIKDIHSFQRFVRLCAGRVGQIFNANNLANEIGVSSVTIQNWLSALQTSYIAFLVQPWSANISKRIIKSPKLYFYDVGLASYLLGIENISHIDTHPLRGSLFENIVILELLKKRYNKGLDNNLYFYRDNHGNEIDVVQEFGGQLNIFEIKSSRTFNSDFLKGLDFFKKVVSNKIVTSYLVYAGNQLGEVNKHQLIKYNEL